MDTVTTPCEVCEGKRFQAEVLEYELGGKNISEVFEMPVAEAERFFAEGEARVPKAHAILERMSAVGLGYLKIGQPLTTLSGGERQRLKLAIHMADKGGVYVLDEPTAGLHLADVENLLDLLDRLVDSGKSVIVIEHNQAVMAHADWIIDLGPGAGHDGGRVVFEGTPADLVADGSTLTGSTSPATWEPPSGPSRTRWGHETLLRLARSLPGDVDSDLASIDVGAIEPFDRSLGLGVVVHFDEPEPAGTPGVTIADHLSPSYIAIRREQGLQVVGIGREREVPNEYVRSHCSPMFASRRVSCTKRRDRPKPVASCSLRRGERTGQV
jgi:hypothetical protein